jgi:carbon monoxide dehydrogenase subunit G
MKIKSDYTVSANREKVWEHLTDPELLRQCIPGCEELKATGGDTYEATIKVGVAGIKGTYKGTVTLENMQPPCAYRLTVEGKSTIGFLKGACDFRLEEAKPDETKVGLNGELAVGGKLARVGQRIIGSAAKMTIGQFFKQINKLTATDTDS